MEDTHYRFILTKILKKIGVKFGVCFLLLFIFLIINSCIQFQGSFEGFGSGYDKYKDSLDIVFVEKNELLDNLNPEYIYAVNGLIFKEHLKQIDNSLIYFWSPNCSSDVCLPIQSVQMYCDKNNLELFVLSEFYTDQTSDFIGLSKNPFFSVNHLYYKANYVNKYQKLFKKDLIGFKPKDSLSWHRYLFFKNDQLLESKNKPF